MRHETIQTKPDLHTVSFSLIEHESLRLHEAVAGDWPTCRRSRRSIAPSLPTMRLLFSPSLIGAIRRFAHIELATMRLFFAFFSLQKLSHATLTEFSRGLPRLRIQAPMRCSCYPLTQQLVLSRRQCQNLSLSCRQCAVTANRVISTRSLALALSIIIIRPSCALCGTELRFPPTVFLKCRFRRCCPPCTLYRQILT